MIHDFEQHISLTLERHALLRRDARVVVAVSGGADSVALLAALTALGYDCVAAHCNFHLRGAESMRDMRHVEAVTARIGVDLCVKDFDVAARRAATGESVEMACRELRYAWFNKLLDSEHAQAIAVGHHREDNVETLFLNLFRGTGIAGLTGMQWRNGYVVRPMLDCSRADIERYLADKGLDYVTDSSNASSLYRRNRLRNELLPLAERLFPGATDAVCRTMSHLNDACSFYSRAAAEAMDRYTDSRTGAVDVAALAASCPDARIVLYEWLKPMGFNMTHAVNILASSSSSGLAFTAGQTTLHLDRGMLTVTRAEGTPHPDTATVSLRHDILSPVGIKVTHHDIAEFRPVRDPAVMYLDTAALDGDAVFAIRPWHHGDRIAPYGMKGTKLVSDILNDAKADSAAKRATMVLTRNDDLLWVIGMRASRLFTVTPATRSFLKLELTAHHS